MTKRRPPLSVDAALARIAGHLQRSWAEMAEVVGKSESVVRRWGDPDQRERLAVDDAIRLDIAYRAAGGEGAPIFEAYGAMLDVAGASFFADQIALSRLAVTLIKECSEAEAAVVTAAQPGASQRERAEATREIEEAIALLTRARLMLGNLPVSGLGATAVAS